MIVNCKRTGCTHRARWGIKVSVPVIGGALTKDPRPSEVFVNLPLCRKHAFEALWVDFDSETMRATAVQYARGRPLDFERVAVIPIRLDSPVYRRFVALMERNAQVDSWAKQATKAVQ